MQTIAEALELQTRGEHTRVEEAIEALRPGASAPAYRRHLERMYGFYQSVEDAQASCAQWVRVASALGFDLDARHKTPWLEQDLLGLGHDRRSLSTVARCPVPKVASAGHAVGAAYVLEGATLGGRVLERRLREEVSGATGESFRFLAGYGAETGRMWLAFRAMLLAYVERFGSDGERHVVAGARATFRTLRMFLVAATDEAS